MNDIYPKRFSFNCNGYLYEAGSFGRIVIEEGDKIRLTIQTRDNNNEGFAWHTCRETLIGEFIGSDQKRENFHFLFIHAPNMGKSIATFIQEVENRLDLKERTQFYGLAEEIYAFANFQHGQISVIKPSLWWKENVMRFGFFTILLRCGLNYDKLKDFEKTLYSYEYAVKTKAAIEKFFQGFTKWAGTVNRRSGSTDHEINEMTWKWGWVKFFEGGQNLELMIK